MSRIFSDFCILDTETTGTGCLDEVLSVAVVDLSGEIMLDTLIRPICHETWDEAQRINGISPEIVEDAPYFCEIAEDLWTVLYGYQAVLGWNVSFDARMLYQSGMDIAEVRFADLMQPFSDAYFGGTWQKLSRAAKFYGIDFKDAHTALGDAKVTAAIARRMIADGADFAMAK